MIFMLLILPAAIRDPLESVVALAGVAVTAAAVVVVVNMFRRHALGRVPARFTESSSRMVRAATRAASSYATLLVGFYTVIAVLLLFGAIGHFL
jgi:hypothetical protein